MSVTQSNQTQIQKLSVAGVSLNNEFKPYILWALKMMKDSNSIFQRVFFFDQNTIKKAKSLNTFDIIIADTEKGIDKSIFKSNAIIAYIRDDEMQYNELELMAKSGFLSLTNMSKFTTSRLKTPNEAPQQPTTKLMFYYIYSLVVYTKIMLALQQVRDVNSQIEIRNNPIDNLVYLCQFVTKMKEANMWNNPQGQNFLDGGAPFYSIYSTKDRKNLVVACIERNFYEEFVKRLPIDDTEKSYFLKNQNNQEEWIEMKKKLQEIIKKQPSLHWNTLYKGTDACVTLVYDELAVLKKKKFKNYILQKPKKNDYIWNQMKKELKLKDGITIVPLAKL